MRLEKELDSIAQLYCSCINYDSIKNVVLEVVISTLLAKKICFLTVLNKTLLVTSKFVQAPKAGFPQSTERVYRVGAAESAVHLYYRQTQRQGGFGLHSRRFYELHSWRTLLK